MEERPGNVTKEGLSTFIRELTAVDDTDSAMSNLVTEIKGDNISVTVVNEGKLGLSFGTDGETWPVVDSIGPDGLLAHCFEVISCMPLRVVRIAGVNGTRDLSALRFVEATAVIHTVGLPMTLVFAKVDAPNEVRAEPLHPWRSSRIHRSPRSPSQYSHRRRVPRRLPETEETIALKRKLKMTVCNDMCSQLGSGASVEFEDVRDVFRDSISARGSEISRWLMPCPTHDLSQEVSAPRLPMCPLFATYVPLLKGVWHVCCREAALQLVHPLSITTRKMLPQRARWIHHDDCEQVKAGILMWVNQNRREDRAQERYLGACPRAWYTKTRWFKRANVAFLVPASMASATSLLFRAVQCGSC